MYYIHILKDSKNTKCAKTESTYDRSDYSKYKIIITFNKNKRRYPIPNNKVSRYYFQETIQ